ncbi:HAMP domain-containing histidine kinase [Lewinella lacunae]|uniref:histidine kinase n=1 Tax=Neolewinella lacunae TaxID=1517758 RepID=A0A923PJ18_9BACT|nr:HAMP domain-containing histidine kinase [Neolewinella lacunae]
MWYTNRLANQLAEVEQHFVELYKLSVEEIEELTSDADLQLDVTFQTEVLKQMETVPRITTDMNGHVVYWAGFGSRDNDAFGERYEDSVYIQRVVESWIEEGRVPVRGYAQLQYFGESRLLRQLRFFPIVQAILIGTFIFLGYLGINQARRAEQNRVWVGMAKETAHQLGTPISAIMGWVEHLKVMYAEDAEILEVSNELSHDVDRLSMVANRFSKIGATPELEPVNVYAELEKCREYMAKRAPRKVSFDFPDPASPPIKIAINPLLFDWVIENLLRNALDAMDGTGRITGRVREAENMVLIDITDTGGGIAPKNVRKVFNPGFTTKKRGWGLGLSLVKRIVEEYHRGRINVSYSEIGVGTTFTIALPRV